MPPGKDQLAEADLSVREINDRLADCSMSSVAVSLDDGEVDRLVHEALPPALTQSLTSDGDDGQGARDMSIVCEPPTSNDVAADVEADAPPPPPQSVNVESPDQTAFLHGLHDRMHRRRTRPSDAVWESGPPLSPRTFPPPRYQQARRIKRVLCYDPSTKDHFFADNILIKVDETDRTLKSVERAYWKMPGKGPIETRMGHLEICHVLKRMEKGDYSDSDSSQDGDDDSSNTSGDGDVVFRLTEEKIALKVNYTDRMQRLADQPAHGGENPLHEIAALQMIGTAHPHVLGCFEVLYDGEALSVVLPYCNGGDLHDLVVEHNDRLRSSDTFTGAMVGIPEDQAKKLFRETLQGLRYLHSLNICMRDLSPENVMIGTDGAVIIDMGMCLLMPYDEEGEPSSSRRLMLPQGPVGKLSYMSPEIYRNRQGFDGCAIDMWCAGTTLFFLLTATKYELPIDPICNAMTSDLAGLLRHWGIHLSEEAVDLMQRLITRNPRERITLEEALDHPWVRPIASDGSDTTGRLL